MTNEELASAIQQGHTEYFYPLWDKTQKLFQVLCNRWWTACGEHFTQCGITQEDLMQECFFILIDVVAAFERDTGYKLTTYIHYPMQNRFRSLLGYRGRRNLLDRCSSLDALISEDDDYSLMDALPDPDSERPFEQIDHADYIERLHRDLEAAMNRKLSDLQKSIVYDYYYLRSSRSDIAEKHGITVDRVGEIIRRSRGKLRCDRELYLRYKDEVLRDTLYKGTSLRSFKNSGMSSVERTVETLERVLKESKLPTENDTEIVQDKKPDK